MLGRLTAVIGFVCLTAHDAWAVSGVIYDSTSFQPLQGMQVFLLDDATGAILDRALLGPGQQGQHTPITGQYQFDPPAGTYRISVLIDPAQYEFPSPKIGPLGASSTAPFGVVDPSTGSVVGTPQPSQSGSHAYYLRVHTTGAKGEVSNNHVPLTATPAVHFTLAARTPRITGGERAAFIATIDNSTTRSFPVNPTTQGSAGVSFQFPDGFTYAPNTLEVRDAATAALVGSFRPTDTKNPSLSGLIVPPLTRYEVRIMATAGAKVRPGSYKFFSTVTAGITGEMLANAQAQLLVEDDPMFDRSEIIGRVFCDNDDNGFFDPGERGIPYARIYLDNGSYAVADLTGKFHFSNVIAGYHLAKVDPDTVPPGSEATRSLRRDFHLTYGLPAKIDFGFRCAVEQASVPQAQEKMPGTIDISGTEAPMEITIDTEKHPAGEVDVVLEPGFQFRTRVKTPFLPRAFSLLVRNEKKDIVFRIDGIGAPPELIPTDFKEKGKVAVEAGEPHWYELVVWSGADLQRSERKAFRLPRPPASAPSAPQPIAILRGNLFSKTNKPMPELSAKLGDLKQKLLASTAAILVDAHTADDGVIFERFIASEKRAQAVKALLVSYGVAAERITARGHGDKAPLAPNFGQRGREQNRRIVISLSEPQAASAPASEPSSLPTSAPLAAERMARVHGADVPWRGPSFRTSVLQAERGSVFMQTEDGRALGVRSGPNTREQIEIVGGINSDKLFVDGVALPLPLASFGCRIQAGTGVVANNKLLQPIGFALSGEMAAIPDVRIGVYAANDTLVDVEVVPPGTTRFDYTGTGAELQPGLYSYRCTAKDRFGGQVTTAPELFTLVASREIVLEAHGELFAGKRVGADLKVVLDQAIAAGGIIKVEVHGSGAGDPAVEMRATDDQAEIVKAYLARAKNATVTSYGKSQQLVPPMSRRALEKNRRVVVRFTPPNDSASAPASEPDVPLKAPQSRAVVINGEPVTVDDKGHFSHTIEGGSALVYRVLSGQGRETVYRLSLGGSSAPTLSGHMPFAGEPPPEAAFSDKAGKVKPASVPVSLPTETLSGVTLELPHDGAVIKQDRLIGHVRAPEGTELIVRRRGPASQPASQPTSEPASQPTSLAASQPASAPVDPNLLATIVVGEDGEAEIAVPLTDGDNTLAFQVKTASGQKGELERHYKMSSNRWFLMALGEAAAGQAGAMAMLPETENQDGTIKVLHDQGFLQGRAMLYFKGQIKGDWFFKDVRFTAFGDTAQQQSAVFWRQVIEPDRFYPIYGDSAAEVQDAQSQNKLYVLIEADASRLEAGNVSTKIKGVELFRYDRALFGGRIDFDKSFTDNKIEHTKLQAFVGQPLQSSRRVHVSMRGTGGSLYLLRDRDIIEGSEVVRLIVRDAVSNSIVQEVTKKRNVDYTIQYDTGRIVFLEPVSGFSQGSFSARLTPISATQGDAVSVEVDYEARDAGLGNQVAAGGYIKESVFGDRVTIGGGVVNEHRGTGADTSAAGGGTPDYKLYGGSLELKPWKGVSLSGELNRSEGRDTDISTSVDGGQSYADVNRAKTYVDANGRTQTVSGWAMKAQGALDFQKMFDFPRQLVTVSGYAARIDPNYYAGVSAFEQGQVKYGVAARGAITEKDFVTLRQDGIFSSIPADPAFSTNPSDVNPNDALRIMHRESSAGGYEHVERNWDAGLLYYHTLSNDTQPGPVINTDTVDLRGSYKLTPKLTLFATEEIIARPDPTVVQKPADQFATEVGARYRIFEFLEGQASEVVRYGGSNSTNVGLRTPFGEDGRVYINERFSRDLGGWTATTIVGGENSVARGSKAYGEYQMDSGSNGQASRAVFGLNNRWQLIDGVYANLTYERAQNVGSVSNPVTTGVGTGPGTIQGGTLPSTTPTYTGLGSGTLSRDRTFFNPSAILGLTFPVGIASRDAFSSGLEFLRWKFLKLTGRFEVRLDQGDVRLNGDDRWTVFGTLGASAQLHRDLSFLSRVEIATAQDVTLRKTLGGLTQATFGLTYRPVKHDYFNAMLKYTRREFEQFTDPTSTNGRDHEILDVISFVPMGEIPIIRTQIVEKLAMKFQTLDLDEWQRQKQFSLLWINRLNFHVFKWLDVSGEYRIKRMTAIDQTQGGFLAEVSFSPWDYMRLGAGYNFTHFSDDEMVDDRIDNYGFFVRAVGKY